MARKPFDYQAAGLDEKIIDKIFSKRRCDYIRKPPKISVEIDGSTVFFQHSSIKDWESFKKRHDYSGKSRTKGRYDYALRRLKALSSDAALPENYRQKYDADYRQLEALRAEERAWGKQEKRIAALRHSGKIIKKVEQVRQEIVFDLVKYIERERRGITLDKNFSLTARIVRARMGEMITAKAVRTIYGNLYR